MPSHVFLTTCRFARRLVRSLTLRGQRSRVCQVFLVHRPLRSGTWICQSHIVLHHSLGSRQSIQDFVAVTRNYTI